MSKELKRLKEIAKELIEISFDLKEKGHDLFVTWFAHTNEINFQLFIGGWEEAKSCTMNSMYLESEKAMLKLKEKIKDL